MKRVLITIPISHYCEKARWALDRAGLVYEEQGHLPAMHRFAVRWAGGALTAPVLVLPDRVLRESAAIVEYADAGLGADQEARALAARFDDELGQHTRRWAYHGLRDQRTLLQTYLAGRVPGWQRRTFALTYRPITAVVNQVLDITPETAAASERTIHAMFDEVGERLGDGRRYLVGDSFTTADLTFAALAAPVVGPASYGTPLPTVEELPPAMAAMARELREHPAGAFAMRMFRDER